jgi:hypothetical protein
LFLSQLGAVLAVERVVADFLAKKYKKIGVVDGLWGRF